jgi:Tfp pilus assembly protein PilZ
MKKYNWSKLNFLQLGQYAEYFAKMEFTLLGFDVYEAEVDDKGIDFVIRRDENKYYDIQVKSTYKGGYIFIQKDKFDLKDNLFLVIVLFIEENPPNLYLIPSTVWLKPNSLFVSHDYIGKKSKPEWGINLSKKNMILLYEYTFDKVAEKL